MGAITNIAPRQGRLPSVYYSPAPADYLPANSRLLCKGLILNHSVVAKLRQPVPLHIIFFHNPYTLQVFTIGFHILDLLTYT